MVCGLCFIDIVETTTKKFDMKYISFPKLTEGREQREGVAMKSPGRPWIMAFVWIDRDYWSFISTTSSFMDGNLKSHWQ